jgi:3-phosphoshikimate 1-carboxyvinyltransferase
MKKLIQPSTIRGTVTPPASKSMMQRAIAASILAKGTSILQNYTSCNDSDAALKIAKDFGCSVIVEDSKITISGELNPKTNILNCGEAGLGIRMFTPIASLFSTAITLNGEGSLLTRPISMLEKPLSQLGVDIKTNNGFVPIQVCGPIKGGVANVDGSMSSQMLTGLLLALPYAVNDSELIVSDLQSKPYIDMTIEVMRDFGVEVTHDDYKIFKIKAKQEYRPITYNVEGDWSGAAFLLVAGAIGVK